MLLGWLDAREATNVGVTLADQFTSRALSSSSSKVPLAKRKQTDALREFLQKAERTVQTLPLNFYKKAKLANAFKWRLLEKGVEKALANEVTHTLVMHLSMNRLAPVTGSESAATVATTLVAPAGSPKTRELLDKADQCVARGNYTEAITAYEAFIKLKPRHARALNNLGAAYWKLGQYRPAEHQFRQAISIASKNADAHSNLGGVLRDLGHLTASETSLRRALALTSAHTEARASLGLTLLALGRTAEARGHLDKALRVDTRNIAALLGMSKIAAMDGRFDDSEALLQRVLNIDPAEPSAWAALAGLRKQTTADSAWLKQAEAMADADVTPLQEVDLRFAIGKHCNDIHEFPRAFLNYRRANDLLKANGDPYDREARTRFVNHMLGAYTRENIDRSTRGAENDSVRSSNTPVLVVGMPRSGTSLVEQIIASHSAAFGAGELGFWSRTIQRQGNATGNPPLDDATMRHLGSEYLRELARHSGSALRVVDKAPVNSDYLGLVHSILPKVPIIYMRRDPIDSCLSCYFQQFNARLDFTMDFGDLEHYFRSHQRLIDHWRAVLPANGILDVPYAELVADQEKWIRRILDFVGLDWDERCLNFQNTKRTVATASAWQVRQKINTDSLGRWHHYEKFIGPLLELRDIGW
jgi:tetratricopeptide (TPR) repeat protein